MAHASKLVGSFLLSRWRRWLPPVVFVAIVVIALVQLTPHDVNHTFHYKLF
jgi:peptidoglycan/LPS O-acetylase OafA/YrhL